jgi:Ni2+-binding GTPase involved in maturation of urease and hydrogenase
MLKSKYILDTFQLEACDCIDKGINVLVSAPTGSGKTAIAEYSIEKSKELFPDGKIVYTCPIKSLCNEKYYDMCNAYKIINEELKTEYQIGLMTGDIIINPDADIIIMTTEVLYNLTITKIEFKPKCVIFDEVHFINDDTRGHIWEKCIISCLVSWDCYLTLLSATIGNIEYVISWLNSINPPKTFKAIIKTERPVPLKEWVITDTPMEITNETYEITKKYWYKLEKDGFSINYELNKLCKFIETEPNKEKPDEIKFGIPVIFFVLSKNKCIELAEMITHTFTNYEENSQILHFFDYNLKEFSNCSQYQNLRRIIGKGIAYHHSGLIPKIREVVEFLMKRKLVKIVFATETFAVGLNFPVKTVVMTSLTKPTDGGFRNLQVSEYKQMAGRAGRRFIDTVGHVIFWFYPNCNCNARDPYPTWLSVNSIINGNVNSIISKYLIEPNYIIKTFATNTLRIFTDKSFKFFNKDKTLDTEIIIPDKFKKLYDIELKIREFNEMGIAYVDKNYKKILYKLSRQEQTEYNEFIKNIFNKSKTEYECFIDWEGYILDFLLSNDFLKRDDETIIITLKGNMALLFNEINPILMVNEFDEIFKTKENILPILSMFIDDGKKQQTTSLELIEWERRLNSKYKNFIDKCPKWNFYSNNYMLIKEWLLNPELTLDEISLLYEYDIGFIVKILIKMYQITEELLKNVDKINKTDLAEYLNCQKQLLIRHPLKIESLYTK